MQILITGGCGFIGSHVTICLLNQGYEIIIVDDLSNSSLDTLNLMKTISGKDIGFYNGKIQDVKLLNKIFSENKINLVMHFAGFKSVSESISYPIKYYENNIVGTLNLIEQMQLANVKSIIFSSSATVYSKEEPLPWKEDSKKLSPTNPYGYSKLFIERILYDLAKANHEFKIGILRYFNPVGAHKSGMLGELFDKNSNNLIPNILNVLSGTKNFFDLYGNNYDTPDGTCIRDYIHINDLVNGHVQAMKYLEKHKGYHVWNLGSGRGYSTLNIIHAFEKKLSKKIPLKIKERRKGDIDEFWADPSRAQSELDWQACETLDTIVNDTLNYFYKKDYQNK